MLQRRRLYISLLVIILIIIIALSLLIKNAGLVVKHKLEKSLSKSFSVERIDLGWRELKAFNAVIKKPDGTIFFGAEQVSMSLNMKGIIRKEFNFSRVILAKPYLLIEINKDGRYMNPFSDGEQKREDSSPLHQISIGRFVINKGSIDYSDRKVFQLPHLTRIRDIEFEIDNIYMPFIDRTSTFKAEASILGNNSTANLKTSGKINLKTLDTDGKVNVSNLDITAFKPYFEKEEDGKIKKGFLDIDMEVTIRGGKIRAPGKAVLRGLEFAESTTKDRFLGVPRSAVIGLLKNNRGTITIDFIIEGDINNPKFNLRESLLEKLTIGLANKFGLSITRIGESIIVGGARQVGKGIEGLGREIERLFK